jgi:branched-chain amino acid transport system substrate-binding protein
MTASGVTAVMVALVAGLVSGCGSDDHEARPVATSSCSALLYEGDGKPDVIVVSDLPRRGIGAQTTKLMKDAIEFVLREHEFRAGDVGVGYQSCNDTVGDEDFDAALCRRNARAYVAAKDVVGVIGPWNSGCAWEQIPIVSRKAAGPLAMISPANTYQGLTRTATARTLNPDGVRSYARVVTHDVAQGAAAAYLAKERGARRVAVVAQLGHSDDYAGALTTSFLAAARRLGLETSSFSWKQQPRYDDVGAAVAAKRPDLVYLAGLPSLNGKTLVEALRAALPNDVTLVVPDGFAFTDVAKELGPIGDGLVATVPGIPHEALPPAGKRFLRAFGPAEVELGQLGAPEAAQAAEVLLDAIDRSDGTRASVVEAMFATKVRNGILGSFTFDRYGDVVPAPVGVYRFENGKIVVEGVIRVPRAGLVGEGDE